MSTVPGSKSNLTSAVYGDIKPLRKRVIVRNLEKGEQKNCRWYYHTR